MDFIKRTATLKNVFVGEGRFDLRLGIGELIDLEELTGCSPFELVERFNTARFRVRDIRETIRLGLIGGGMNPEAAFDLMTRYVVEGYLADYVATAGKLVLFAISGPEDDPVGEPEAVPETPATETAPSDGRKSTRSRARPAGQSKK